MTDQFLRFFYKTGDVFEAIGAVEYCRKNGFYNTGLLLGKGFLNIFPTNITLLLSVSEIAYNLKNYELCFDLCEKILEKQILGQILHKAFLLQKQCIDFVANRYTNYNPELVETILQHKSKNMITFTITTCKRYDLFEQTINSFINCCQDIHMIDKWLCVDDNSNEEDRKKMQEKYPFFEFYFKTKAEKGHPQSMNIIRNKVTTPYIFHMEDDWKFFCKRNYITHCLDVLGQSSQIGQCLINKNYMETANDLCKIVGGFEYITDSGYRYIVHEHYSDKESQMKFMEKYNNFANCAYWPHFSFRPSLLRTVIIKQLGEYNEKISHFEMDYSYRYRNAGYVSAFMEGLYCLHTGRLTSERDDPSRTNAYILNDEKQFTGKEEVSNYFKVNKDLRIRTYVVNLDRRPDRWENFCKQEEIKFLNYSRFSAVDGSKLLPNEQLQRIFEGNDYDMREGMVGCAMSHLKLYTELANSDDVEVFCIFEDDLEFVPGFQNKLLEVFSQLLTNHSDWDMCYLGHHLWKKYRSEDFYDKEKSPIIEKWNSSKSLQYSMGGTGGYLISKKGAIALLEFINKNGMTNGIDTVQQKSADTLNIYYCKPHLIYSECCIPGETKSDTDIQYNYRSLTIPLETRLENEINFYSKYGNIVEITDVNNALAYAQDKTKTETMFYIGSNVRNLLQLCVHPCYSLDYQVLVVVPCPNDDINKQRYFERLKKGQNFDVSDALKYKPVVKMIPLSDMTHVYEAIKSFSPGNLEFPFDKTDGGKLDIFILLIELIVDMTDNELEVFVGKLCDPKTNEIKHQAYNNRDFLVNNSFHISFPHDDIKQLVPVYVNKFRNLRDAIKSGEKIVFVHCTRHTPSSLDRFYYFADFLCKINPNALILTINGIKKEDNIDEEHSKIIHKRYVDFPVNLHKDEWTSEKIKYDQDVFRLAIVEPIKNFALKIDT